MCFLFRLSALMSVFRFPLSECTSFTISTVAPRQQHFPSPRRRRDTSWTVDSIRNPTRSRTMMLTNPKILLLPIVLLISLFFIYQRERLSSALHVIRPDLVDNPKTQLKVPIVPVEAPISIADGRRLDNLLRTQAQCMQDFPDLYDSVDTSVSHYAKHSLRRTDLEDAFKGAENLYTWVVIRNNQLYIRSRHGGFQSRVQAVLADLHRAIVTSPERLPDIEFLFNSADSAPSEPYTPVFGLSRGLQERAFMISDFGYWSWPEALVNGFTAFQNQADRVEAEVPWEKKTNQLFWRGNPSMNKERERLISISDHNNETWGNVRGMDWGNLKEGDRYDMADHCRFKFLAHIEGATYSARLKYLQHCNSVIVTHERKWTTPLSHLLKSEGEEQNIVVLGPGFDGVEKAMEDLLANNDKAKRIARNSQETFGKLYGRLDAEVCYWRYLIRGYYSIMAPDFRQSVSSGHDSQGAKDYETVMLMDKTEVGVV